MNRATHPVDAERARRATSGERAAERMATIIGSWRLLGCQTVVLLVWIVLNVVAAVRHWDPYPFILLNLMLSFQAAYTGPILLIAANRSESRDRQLAEHDHQQLQTLGQLLGENTRLTNEVHAHILAGADTDQKREQP